MSFNIGWSGASTAPHSFAHSAQDHLRIKDLARSIDAADLSYRRSRQAIAPAEQLRSSYDISVRNIDDNIYAMAAATAALDKIESKLGQAKEQIEQLCRQGYPVDLNKVERTLVTLAEHVNTCVQRADENHVNLLRDSRLQVRIAEVGGSQERSMQVNLTLISLDKLIAWKLRDEPSEPEAWIDLIDTMSKVVTQNVQILSSLILTLFAARDYTTDVVKLVMSPTDSGSAGSARQIATDFVQSARAALAPEVNDRSSFGIESKMPMAQPSRQPNRLMAFLSQVTFLS